MAEPFPLGDSLSEKYEIIEGLGQGSFGVVFKAVQKSTGQAVAIKACSKSSFALSGHEAHRIARFEREARLCAALNHPHIVRLVDKGQSADHLYLVFEFVPGETLTQLLARRGALPPLEAIAIGGQILEALDSAHGLGIVHRDLKPDNIMVTGSGPRMRAKVLDFGVGAFLAGGLDGAPDLTQAHEILGTPSYAAPEQLRGEPATPRSDIYAWALVLLECLTGKRVMDGATMAQVFHRQLSPVAIAVPAPFAGHPLGDVLRRALAKSVRERAQHAGLLWEELRRVRVSELPDPPVPDPAAVPRTVELGVAPSAEQHQVSVLSVNLMVLPGPRHAPDVETLEAMLQEQMNLCSDIAARFGGQVTGVLAGRLVAVFGIPHATDSDARRACRAALELGARIESRRSLLQRQSNVELDLRIGIDTGLVIVGADGAVSGLALSLATHLESLAPPGVALVSQGTRDLAHRHFAFRRHELTAGQGARNLVQAYALLPDDDERGAREGASERSASELVGRQEELDLLVSHWRRARVDSGRTLLVRGEPGVGKTRLVRELRQLARRESARVLEAQCMPEDRGTALSAVLGLIRRVLELEGESDVMSQSRLERLLAQNGSQSQDCLLLACSWLGVTPPEAPASALSPELQRSLLLTALARALCSANSDGGTLLIIEDIHWADPTTIDLISQLQQHVPAANVLLLLSARREGALTFEPAHVLELSGLARADVEQLVAQCAGGVTLERESIEQIVERTDGVPLFVEELTRHLIEAPPASHEAASASVPLSLRGLLEGRLTRLGPAKETAQLAAAIGREFDLGLLRATSQRGEAGLHSDLQSLLAVGVLHKESHGPEERYTFRHALIREAAADSLLPQKRRAIHAAIARALEARAGTSPSEAARLAVHHELAGQIDSALAQRMAAGQHAARASAYREAIFHYREGIRLCPELEAEDARTSWEIDFCNALGAMLIATEGFATDAVVGTFTRAQTLLAGRAVSPMQRFTTLKGMITFCTARAENFRADQLCAELLELAEQHQTPELLLGAHECACRAACITGRFRDCVLSRDRCERYIEGSSAQERAVRYGVDPWPLALSFSALAHTLLGELSRARKDLELAREAIASAGAPHEALLLGQASMVELFIGSSGERPNAALSRCRSLAHEAVALAQRGGQAFAETNARNLIAMADCLEGSESALAAMKQVMTLWRMAGVRSLSSWQYAFLARGHLQRGEYGEALDHARAAMEHCETTGEGYGTSEAYRMLGVILGDRANPSREPERAARSFSTALDVAREQHAHWLELRAAYDFAKTLGLDGLPREALGRALAALEADPAIRETDLFRECVRLTG
jgi:TOMM system kinase/cyclase fusion protein